LGQRDILKNYLYERRETVAHYINRLIKEDLKKSGIDWDMPNQNDHMFKD